MYGWRRARRGSVNGPRHRIISIRNIACARNAEASGIAAPTHRARHRKQYMRLLRIRSSMPGGQRSWPCSIISMTFGETRHNVQNNLPLSRIIASYHRNNIDGICCWRLVGEMRLVKRGQAWPFAAAAENFA